MCMNKEASFGAWIVSLIIGVFLYLRNKLYDRWNALFLVTFTTIQLLEGGLWISIEKHKEEMNSVLTKAIIVALLAQPLVQTYLGYLYTGSSLLHFLSFVFGGLFIWSVYKAFTIGNVTSRVGSDGH